MLALEGVMLVSTGATSSVALAVLVLVLINAVANRSVIALARDATKRRYEADLRRAATRSDARGQRRARSRATGRGAEKVDAPVPGAKTTSRTAARPARPPRGESVYGAARRSTWTM